jgi:hypothetical protein
MTYSAPPIHVFAGPSALATVRDAGIQPDRVRAILGAAGGPKWLVLSAMDRQLFGSWLRNTDGPQVFLLGSSIGAWRFAAACRKDPVAALECFLDAYIHQRYSPQPSPDEISKEAEQIQGRFLPLEGVREILNHPRFRLNIVSARCLPPLSSRRKPLQALGLTLTAAANLASPRLLRLFFERVVFSDFRDPAPFMPRQQMASRTVPLHRNNLRQALRASGAIPLVMRGVRDIPGAPAGTYRDGGILDYHMAVRSSLAPGEIVLFPHYMDRIVPGWLDKKLPWRSAGRSAVDNVLMIAPSQSFVRDLPLRRIPDRNDFYRFKGRDEERFGCWKRVVEASERMADAFFEAVLSGAIRRIVQPLP